MNAVSPICLTDLAPALRWSKSADVADVLRHTRLVDGWWRSLPLPRVLDIAGPTWLAHCLARLTVEQWDHLAICEFLPTLRALAVDMDEIAEPVRGAVLATAGNWEQLISASPSTMREWGFPGNCDVVEVVSMVMWRAVNPFTGDPSGGPTPSPALMIEAVRTIANWMPSSAPDHVHNALAYLTNATGAECAGPTTDPEETPQSPATRAIRTLRALRANRDRDPGEEQAPPASRSAAHARAEAAEPVPALARRGGSPLLGPGRTLRRPSFGPPKAMRGMEPVAVPVPSVVTAPAPELGEHPLIDLIDQLCRGWNDLERLIVTERLFTSEPTSIRLLADQLQMDIGELRGAQRTVEDRLLQWLGSPDGAPMSKHVRDVSEQLGSATTIDHLISAHPDHPVDVPSLGIPLWRIVMTLFTDRRLDDNWLLTSDTGQLRWQTRQLVVGRPSVTEAGIRLATLGIRAQALRAWLLNTPGVSIQDGYVLVDEAVPLNAAEPAGGFGGHTALTPDSPKSTTANGLPIRRRPTASQPRPEPKAGVASSARCFRAPDGRWWHRVDVTGDQLNGAPVTVPPGYATHLGLQPGRLLCLTGPGADLLVLVWRDQPAFDSLRPLLRRQGAQAGDRVFITVNGDRLDARLLPTAALGDPGPTGKALSLIGYTAHAGTEEALDIIARRISENGEAFDGSPNELLELLAKRGDDDIVAELRNTLYAAH
ncbi:hypothetical protein [Actinorugispora endophytica]|uniref:Uncharacterized protein n=1 Tax=Actinorugispora endophytica TaxID=1605990 RepID=A0A4R6URM1_9ACTN|nr:hypothetical protein [Actinorugispora endophytica]TDQ45954.1 hypothetical protein EV190_12712 [Actinorugispora endophytica]